MLTSCKARDAGRDDEEKMMRSGETKLDGGLGWLGGGGERSSRRLAGWPRRGDCVMHARRRI